MKRLTYISAFAAPLSRKDVEMIEETSIKNNRRDNLTGALFCFRDLFYQVIEGDEKNIDQCYERILKDPRHKDIFCLKVEPNIQSRLYGNWAMKTVVLDDSQEELLIPLRNMLDNMARTQFALGKFAPPEILGAIQSGRDPLTLPSFKTSRIVLFADIMGSTTLTELLSTETIARMLAEFYAIANRAIQKNGGTISKLTGDGLMSYFPIDKGPATIAAALEILVGLQAYRQKFDQRNPEGALFAGIGISAGDVLEGSIGSMERKDYTLLGDSVNSAARLESVTRKVGYGLVFDSRFRQLLPANLTVKKIGQYKPKGKNDLLQIFTMPGDAVKLNMNSNQIRERILASKMPEQEN